jgi:uncharacterized protein (DUF1786 family)
VLGVTLDPRVAQAVPTGALVGNLGNFHCLVFRLGPAGVEGLFEHHTGEVTRDKLDALITSLARSTLQHADVYDDMGHGALVYEPRPMPARKTKTAPPYFLALSGPRRALMQGSAHQPYLAVPFGDMMLSGCFGLLRAMADVFPQFADQIQQSLRGGLGRPPWEALA